MEFDSGFQTHRYVYALSTTDVCIAGVTMLASSHQALCQQSLWNFHQHQLPSRIDTIHTGSSTQGRPSNSGFISPYCLRYHGESSTDFGSTVDRERPSSLAACGVRWLPHACSLWDKIGTWLAATKQPNVRRGGAI